MTPAMDTPQPIADLPGHTVHTWLGDRFGTCATFSGDSDASPTLLPRTR